MAAGEQTLVRADSLSNLVTLLRRDGVEVTSTDRETITVRGLDAAAIGRIANEADVSLTALVPQERTLEDLFMELTAGTVEYHGAVQLVGAAR